MKALASSLIALIALLHVWFMILEMVLWTKPLGRKIFRNSPEFAKASAKLAANQGLYNGFWRRVWGGGWALPALIAYGMLTYGH